MPSWLIRLCSASLFAFSLLASHGEERGTVAILGPHVAAQDTSSASWQQLVRWMLVSQALQKESIRVLPESSVTYGYRRSGLDPEHLPTAQEVRRLGESIQAQLIVWGFYQKEGKDWILSMQVMDVATGRASESFRSVSRDLFNTVSEVRKGVLQWIGSPATPDEAARMNRPPTTSVVALESLARAYAAQELTPDLRPALERAVALDPGSACARLALADVLIMEGRLDEAVASARIATNARPDVGLARLILGEAYEAKGLTHLAREEFQEAARIEPDSVRAHLALGRLYTEEAKWPQASSTLQEAQALAPYDPAIHALLGRAYIALDKRDLALVELRAAESCYPEGDASALFALAESHRFLHELPLAVDYYEKFLALVNGQSSPAATRAEKRLAELKPRLAPTLLPAVTPRLFTQRELNNELKSRLTATEYEQVTIPFVGNQEIYDWAEHLVGDARAELEEASRLFSGLNQRLNRAKLTTGRTAVETFKDLQDPKAGISCQDHTFLYMAMARHVGLKAHYVLVETDHRGKSIPHACAGVLVDDRLILVDPNYNWFGVPHKRYEVLDDLRVIGAYLAQSRDLPKEDILMLTAAVRDLHRGYPGQFLTSTQTQFPELWMYNPHITTTSDSDASVELIECQYPLICRSNQVPRHFLDGFIEFLNANLGLRIELAEFRGDIHMSHEEMSSASPGRQLLGYSGPYWIIASGGKRDFTIKWWDHRRFQQVVDHFRGRIQFVQVGGEGNFHPELDGVLDLRGRTTLRQLVCLMYHADGVVCPVTFLMHLAAAVPTKRPDRLRPCVVIAGGREPPHWESYPGHQLLHTVGMLPCCRTGGCWRARTKPLPDNSHFNRPEHLCVDVVGNLPRCMDMIQAADVIRRIELYLEGGEHFHRLLEEGQAENLQGMPSSPHVAEEREKSVLCDELHRCRPSTDARTSVSDECDLILAHYRKEQKSLKRPLSEDLSDHALTNTPQGLGDTILLSHLPVVAARQSKTRYIASENGFFETLMRFNPEYVAAVDRPRISANALQVTYDLGNGHLIQRLQRAFGLQAELLPRGEIAVPRNVKTGRTVLHFEAGATHAAWQRVYVHHRARELYPESQRIVQDFVEAHPEMSFVQVGTRPLPLQNVEDRTGLPLEDTIRVMADCEYFVGIVSGPMHLATALGLKCVVILNFPQAAEIILPALKDTSVIESEWLYPQNVHLHQEGDGPLVKRLSLLNLERGLNGELYPYWSDRYLSLIHEAM